MIVKQRNLWVVKSTTGKVLGKHKSKKAAVKQLSAVEGAKRK